MKAFCLLLIAAIFGCGITSPVIRAAGFTDSTIQFYGEVRQVGGARTVLLQAGELEMTFVNQSNPANRVTLKTGLRPTGGGAIKPWSYALKVPMAYLPEAPRIDEFLSIGTLPTSFKIQEITINGVPATLPDGSKEFYGLSFASRASDYRLDLLIPGDSTDSDHDTLPDWWESLYGLNPNLADAETDFDGDGWSNLEEYRRGGNPALDNRIPQLATGEIHVPESGEAGLYLHVLDSDTPDSEIRFTLSGQTDGGFVVKLNGLPLPSGESRTISLADLQSGRVTIAHTNRAAGRFALPLSWSDGGDAVTGQLLVSVILPSTRDGSDASLWLDGMDLSGSGGRIAVWADRSGNKRNASQPLPDHQPVATNHSADFSSSNSAHLFFQDTALPAGNHTVFATYHAPEAADAPRTLFATNRGYLQLAPTSQAVSYPGAPTYQMDSLAVRGYENSSGDTVSSIFRRDGNLLENVFGLSYDGEPLAAIPIDPVLPTLGARRSAIPSGSDPVDQPFGGQLKELLVFPTALPEQKLRDIHDYLQSKWSGAVIWDLSTGFAPVNISAITENRRQIIRGGHGDDRLGGGPLNDTISGGPGNDILTGGLGSDRFVFGGVDTGKDRITDYDLQNDIIDLSALFWGKTGDARLFISVRLDTDFSTPIPRLDSVLVVKLATGGTQEIVLENRVVGSTQLIQLIGEGRIQMGGLSIPSGVQISLASGASPDPTQPFNIVVSRSGAGVAAALDVPLGFFEETLGGHFIIEGAVSNASLRSVVHFARGETTKTLTVRPIPDLDTTGPTSVQVAVLPHFRYAVSGTAVTRTISDKPIVWLEVLEANAVSGIAQPASLRVHRDGGLAQDLTVNVHLGGSAIEGAHILSVPDSITIPAGQSSSVLLITARPEGLEDGAKIVLFELAPRDGYQPGDPREALFYVASTLGEANTAGFDRWLAASTYGAMTKLGDLAHAPREVVDRHVQAYAFGLDSANDFGKQRVSFRIVDRRPEILAVGTRKSADLRWNVESSSSLGTWSNTTGKFSESAAPNGLKFVGETLELDATQRFYRLGINLNPGMLASTSIAALAHATRTGLGGNASWNSNQASGELVSSGSNPGDISLILAEVGGSESLDFEMKVMGSGPGDLFSFYIDGVKHSETTGGIVRVQRTLTGSASHLLMWEFKRGAGNAVIRNLAP